MTGAERRTDLSGVLGGAWVRLGLRGQQLAASLVVAVSGLAVFGVVAGSVVEDNVVARIEEELWHTAGACAVAIGRADRGDVDAVVDDIAAAAAARVTVVDAAGVVVGDSNLDGAELAGVSSHDDRPEIRAARETGRGVARRKSATLDVDSLYVARQAGPYTVRASLPLHAVDETLQTLRGFFVGAFLLAFVVAGVGAAAASTAVSRRLRALLADVRRMRVAIPDDDDEVSTLARSFEAMAASLEKNVRALAAERDRVASLLEAMDEGVVALDDDGRVVLCNRAARSLLGLGLDVLGAPLGVAGLAAVVDDARAGRGGTVEVEVDAGGRRQRVLVRATAKGEQQSVVLVAHDVSEVRRLETLRKDFVANVSHELRTPCSVILANAETLLSGAIDDGPRALKFVEDDGPGVEEKHKERLFERFYRVDPGRSRDVGGTGLGLAIVKHLVEAMGGSVSVDDAEPHGTRFCVDLPVAGSARAVSLSAPAASEAPRRSVRDFSVN